VTEHRPMSVSLWDVWGSKRGVYLMTVVPLDPWGNEGDACSTTSFVVLSREPIPHELLLDPNVTHPDLHSLHLMAASETAGATQVRPEESENKIVVGVALPENFDRRDDHISGPRGFLEEVWVLNLDRRPDRWEAMKEVFCTDFLRLRCRRFPALDVRDPIVYQNVHDATDPAREIGFGVLTDAEVAITYGLMEMLQQVVLFKLDAALLIEDDVVVNPKVTRQQLLDTLRRIPPDADLVYLGYCHNSWHPLPDNYTETDRKDYWGLPLRLGYCYCNHAFLMGWRGAKKMLDLMDHNGSRFHEGCKTRILRCYLAVAPWADQDKYFGQGIFLQGREEYGTDNQRPHLKY